MSPCVLPVEASSRAAHTAAHLTLDAHQWEGEQQRAFDDGVFVGCVDAQWTDGCSRDAWPRKLHLQAWLLVTLDMFLHS